jgi:hypothetical protein
MYRTILAVLLVAFASTATISTSYAKGKGGDNQHRGKDMEKICGSMVRAKFCGGAEIHCPPGPTRVQANQQIEACVHNGGTLAP